MSTHPVVAILFRWPSRKDVHADVRKDFPDLDMVAVHRWFSRCSVPVRYWNALSAGARRRKIDLSLEELVEAHSEASAA